MSSAKFSLFAFIGTSLIACSTMADPRGITIHARNFGTNTVSDVKVESKEWRFEFGDIVPIRGESEIGTTAIRWPSQIKVSWNLSQTGESFQKVIDVPPMPQPRPGEREPLLVLIFFDDEVLVRARTQVARLSAERGGYVDDYGEDVEARRRQGKKSP